MSTMNESERPGQIVIGVDGSDNSRAALLWAAQQARLTGAHLHVITAWTPDVDLSTAYGMPAMPPPDYDPQELTRQSIEAFVTETLGEARSAASFALAVGPTGRVLTEAAGPGDLLVLGSHGHSVVRQRLLGSTTEYCIRHARCPVLVLPAAITES